VSFSDPQAVARYAEGPARQVPGFHALQRMTALLLAESVPAEGTVLVLGAGGGLELKVFADAQPGWRFIGVDPSAEMLDLARSTLGPLVSRVDSSRVSSMRHRSVRSMAPPACSPCISCPRTNGCTRCVDWRDG